MTANSYLRQEWQLDGGRLLLMLDTERAVTPDEVMRFGELVAAVEASGFVSPIDGSKA